MQSTSIKILFDKIDNYISGEKTKKLIIDNIGYRLIDLLFYIPYKLVNAPICKKWEELEDKKHVLLKVIVKKHYNSFKYSKAPYRITVSFNEKNIDLVFFAKYTGYLRSLYKENDTIFITGTLALYGKKFQILHPILINEEDIRGSNSLIKIIYRQKGGLKTKIIHKAILSCLKNIPKLSEWNKSLFKKYSDTPSWDNAILNFHTAKDPKALDLKSPSFMRLAYDEMLAKQLSLAIIRKNILEDKGNSYNNKKNQLVIKFTKMLPFKITQNQNDIINEIINDLNSSKKMLRLLHGDVGSGKTVVAIASALYVINSGYQVALMVPTELLAIQHYNQVKQLFDKLKLKVYLLTSSSEKKSEILKLIALGQVDLVIGTHSLIQKNVKFKRLSYIIIDEQHRFGVEQRLRLRNKGNKVDMLLLSATPIPRTMMLATLGDISVSTIKEKPFNNKVETILKTEKNIDQVIVYLKEKLKFNNKVFWICPMIEDTDDETSINKSSIEIRYKLIKKSFKDVGLLHGKLESYQKKEILDGFRTGKIKILISTVVIEVGIDIPDANIILIDHADRFGLAQIHQLRGRVGRGNENGICILLYKEPLTETALSRLITLKKSSDGFEIAEKDLIMRGGGEALGKKQYGFEMFLFFDLITHKNLINIAIKEAKEILKVDPKLQTERGRALIELLYLFEKNKAINLISAG